MNSIRKENIITKRILIVSNMYPSDQKKYSGIFVKNQYEELLRQKSDTEIIDIFFLRRSFTSKIGSIKKYVAMAFRFIPYLFKKYEVVHLHYFVPLIMIVWFYKFLHPKTKLIVTFHGCDVNRQVTTKNRGIYRFFAKKIDFTIPVGENLAENMEQKLSLKTGKILPVGIDQNTFYQVPNAIKEYDFIFVGSFFMVKGVDILFEVLKSLSPSVKFCVVGKGEEYEKRFAELKEKGHDFSLLIDQSQDDLRELYNRSKYLFLPSRSEGFPTVTVEAMYCGTPVVTSDIPQFREQVKNGVNGFMFTPEDKSRLPEFLMDILNTSQEEYKMLSDGALQSFNNISLTNICKELLIIYRS